MLETFEDLLGCTLSNIEQGDDELIFTLDNGDALLLKCSACKDRQEAENDNFRIVIRRHRWI